MSDAFSVASPGASSLGDGLVVPGVQVLDQGQQLEQLQAARLASPQAVAQRSASETAYESLGASQAARLASQAFPALVNEPAGGLVHLPAGARVSGYRSDHAALVDLAGGHRALIESAFPIATESAPGRYRPINLALTEAGGALTPASAVVGVRIPKRLDQGVFLSERGISLSPVSARGVPLSASNGASEGAAVLFANLQSEIDTDVLVKPTAIGFEEELLLRSERSPRQLAFRVGVPKGARLAQSKSGSVMVLEAGKPVAAVLPPTAQDAVGTQVPVSLRLSGDVLRLTVDEQPGEYAYPIAVDPTVVDKFVGGKETGVGNWKYYVPKANDIFGESVEAKGATPYLEIEPGGFSGGEVEIGQYGYWEYTTQGESKITRFRAETSNTAQNFNMYMAIAGHSGYESGSSPTLLSNSKGWSEVSVATPANNNTALFEGGSTKTGHTQGVAEARGPEVTIEQEVGPSVSLDTTDKGAFEGENAFYGPRWASTTSAIPWYFRIKDTDPGLGISSTTWSSPSAPKWGQTYQNACRGAQCNTSSLGIADVKGKSEQLPEGEDTIAVKVEDPVGLSASTETKVKIDDQPPYNVTFTGLPSSAQAGENEHLLLNASATDGTKPTVSSGVASIVVLVDGQQLGSPSKGCSPGECTATGEWTLNTEAYAAGQHTIAVVATDNAGNVTRKEYPLTIHHAGSMQVGPGRVSRTTGELGLTATDVDVAAAGANLIVGRSYSSRHLTSGAEGPLGPQWSLSLAGEESLSKLASGSMVLTGSSGEQVLFASVGSGRFTSPSGDSNMSLTETEVYGVKEFELSENGTTTVFTVPTGGTGTVFEPTIKGGVDNTGTLTFAWRTEKGVTEPTKELAPVPTGVSCSPKLEAGCRELSFTYATETTAKGEGPTEWGEFAGRLTEVTLTAYEPVSKEMQTKAVAQYVYDKQGRLRAEWNPQISPNLKTIYGYDVEGHIMSLAPAGEQPWLVEQGTTTADAGTGRVLAIARPAATSVAELKTEMAATAPGNTAAPSLSSTKPVVGIKISVSSNGTWSNSPAAYTYQWQDCNSSGKECSPIPGAVNQSYYPVKTDEGHTLVANVVALNANAAVSASSAATEVVATGTPNTLLPEPPAVGTKSVWTIDYQVPLSGTGVPQMTSSEVAKWGQSDVPQEATAVFPPDEPMGWPAKEYKHATIYYLDHLDRVVNTSTPAGGISTTEYNNINDVLRTLSADNRAVALAAGEKAKELSKELDTESTYNEAGSEPGTELLSTLGPKHTIELPNSTHAEAREHTVYSYNEGAPAEGGPYHLVTSTTSGAEVSGKEETATVRTTKTSYSGQNNLGWKLRKPTSTAAAPTGLNISRSMAYEPKTGGATETRSPAFGPLVEEQGFVLAYQFGKLGAEKEQQFKEPRQVAVGTAGDVYVLDTGNNRVVEYGPTGKFIKTWGKEGTGPGQFKDPQGIATDSKGDVWVADTGNNRVQEFTTKGGWEDEITEKYVEEPKAIAVTNYGEVWVAMRAEINEYTIAYEKVYAYHASLENDRADEEMRPAGLTLGAEGNFYATDAAHNKIIEWNAEHRYVKTVTPEGAGALKSPQELASDSSGDLWVADSGDNRLAEYSATGTYLGAIGKEGIGQGQMKEPKGVALDLEGNVWGVNTANSNIQKWTPHGNGYGSDPSAHTSQTIYYTAGTNSLVAACGSHPEWANLPCQTQPAAQPEGSLPKLETITVTYNIWDEPLTTTNMSGTTERKTTDTYDAAGRVKTTSTASPVGTALPTVTDKYNEETGALEEQSTTTEGKTKAITNHFNTLGELTSYTDASENTATYEYEVDGRIAKTNDGKGTQTYTYNPTTDLLGEIADSSASNMKFTATYDAEGNLLTEGYPNGMNAIYTYNAIGEATSLEYKKNTHCTEKCAWFTDTVVPSIHGQWLEQTSSLSHQTYSYDEIGRLTQVQNTPAGKGCTTRIYAYDADTNRTSLTTREPNAKGECATEGGTVEKHTYDEADRLTDAGAAYSTFGDITALSAADAGGSELTSTYYVDNQVASQTQNGETIGYSLDPDGRTRETIATGKTAADITYHYAGPGNAPAWTSNTAGETTRNIPGVGGSLVATQSNLETPVLQLRNLHGDIIATAYLSETATGLASSADTSEYGVPTTSLPPKYSWLGALEIPTELPSGVTGMGARSYVPQLGRFLQPDPLSGGSANAYSYTFGDPVNTSDPSGMSTIAEVVAGHWASVLAEYKPIEEAEIAAEQARARAEAEHEAERAQLEAEWAAGPQYTGGQQDGGSEEEWEEYEEEEGGYEWAAYHPSGESKGELRLEPAVLYQPLGEAREGEAGGSGSAVPLCVEGSEAPCGRDTGGRGPGEKCGSMYEHKPCHHGGGGHGGGPEAKKKCPPGYSEIPLVHLCISFEWPSGPSPAPSYGPYPEPVPVGP